MADRFLVLLAIFVAVCIVSVIANALIRRRHHIERIERADLREGAQVVVFTSPYCHGCRQWLDALGADSVETQAIDISQRPDAAARYKISHTPRIAVVDPSGSVLREFDHYEPRRSDLDAIGRLVTTA